MATEGGTFVSVTGGTFETAMPGTFVSAAGGTFETVMPGTFHSTTGGTFETVLGGTIKPLPSDEAPKVMPRSPIGKAIEYTYKIYYRLSRYHLDGRYLPDNNLIENSIRPIAIGRKNYLFCKNDDAAEDAAIIYTMMGCCKAAGADFRKWTTYFLKHIHEYDSDYSRPLDDFLPATLKERGLV